jgi:hypothetical protein
MMIKLIKLYRSFISPLTGPSCRFTPTCSAYTIEAIEKHGVIKGMMLGSWRILRCNPWNKCNHDDPVPETFQIRQLITSKRSAINGRHPTESCEHE